MNPLALRRYKNKLLSRAAELSRGLRERNTIVIEQAADALDKHRLAFEREMAGLQLGYGTRQLRQVEFALTRIANGTFGMCLGCERPIPSKRLNALPWAAYCVPCQQQRDGDENRAPAIAVAA
jgi:DnaK suppressor protein